MKILFQIINYFILRPFDKFLTYLALESNRRQFVFYFNLISWIRKSKNRIILKDNFYYCSEKNWRFFHKKQGLGAYSKGFEKRAKGMLKGYIIENIKFNKDDVVIDIGANNGDFYLSFDKTIKYYAYEPSPLVFSNLDYNIKNQNLFNLGVSNTKKKDVEFYLKDDFGDSSILPIINFKEIIKIDTVTLDDIIESINSKIKLIKIESEGYEPEILEGLEKFIDKVNYITIDCGFERGIEQSSTLSECSNYLIKKDFKMIKFRTPRIVTLFENKNFKSY